MTYKNTGNSCQTHKPKHHTHQDARHAIHLDLKAASPPALEDLPFRPLSGLLVKSGQDVFCTGKTHPDLARLTVGEEAELLDEHG